MLVSSMRFLNAVGVDDELVDEVWKKVSGTGSYYSIADGVSKATFRRMLFESALVLRGESIVIRLSVYGDSLEVHPITVGHSVFHRAHEAIADIAELRDRLFVGKAICCIIPSRMKGAKRLAEVAGMTEGKRVVRNLSGVPIPCTVFTWR